MKSAHKSRSRFTRCLRQRDLLSSRLRAYFLVPVRPESRQQSKKGADEYKSCPGMLQVRQYRHGCAGHLTHSLAASCRDWKQTKLKASVAAVLPAISATFKPFFQFGYIDKVPSYYRRAEAWSSS